MTSLDDRYRITDNVNCSSSSACVCQQIQCPVHGERNRILSMEDATLNLLHNVKGLTWEPELDETPGRVQRAWDEMLCGYAIDIDGIFKSFDGHGEDQLVTLGNIGFNSVCLHHLLNFSGVIHVGYLPNGKVLGASKIPRLVKAYACRLQLQERLVSQIARALMEHLQPRGVAVIAQGHHLCMSCRGVKAEGSIMANSIMLGAFRDNPALRAEFMALIGLNKEH